MNEERRLSKTEASLGLSLIGGLLVTLAAAYIHQLDAPVPVHPFDPDRRAAEAAADGPSTAVERTAYRPEWLSSQTDSAPQPQLR